MNKNVERWLNFAIRNGYIHAWVFSNDIFSYKILDNSDITHTMPIFSNLDSELPIWLFGLYFDTNFPKETELSLVAIGEDDELINRELDIIRGRIPTPKGYKVDPERIKYLMTKLRLTKNKEKL